MAKELPSRFGITPHATRRIATRQIIVGGSLILMSGVALAAGVSSVDFLVIFAVMGSTLAGLGLYTRSVGAAVQVVNKAFNLASFGKLRDAGELLDFAEATFRLNYIRRVIDLQRSVIAMRRGELEDALRYVDAAIVRPLSLISRYHERMQLTAAHAIRAVLRASTGDRDGALADIEVVQQSAYAAPEALARVELAAALLLERTGDKEALRAHLAKERRLLLEHTHPRERAIVRAYQRMLKATSTTIYRTGAPREPVLSEEPALADWAAKISPGAAPFVRAPAPGVSSEKSLAGMEAEGVDPKALRAAEGRSKGKVSLLKRRFSWVFLIWILLIGMFLAIWQFLAPGDVPDDYTQQSALSGSELLPLVTWALPMFLVLVAFGMIALRLVRARRHTHRLLASLAAVARGEEDRAVRDLTALGRSSASLVAAQAHLTLAELAEQRSDLPAALAACEEALARLGTETARAVAADILLPNILAERAFLFAAMDRSADARAEMILLAERYPSYPFLERAKLRVSLAEKARKGDVVGAARLAEQSADLPLNPRDELLADLARAAENPEAAGAGELERLREELRVDAASRRWIEVVAPAALAAFTRAGQPIDETERDARAEEEALAEAEVHAGAAVLRSIAGAKG
jgi:hypothetical protein